MRYYISIEKNIEGFESFKLLWKKLDVFGIRANTLTEGIQKAVEIENSKTDELYFIDIVADDINYLPQLKLLSAETNAPILIATSRYDDEEHHEALNNGADFYGRYCQTPEQNITGVLSVLKSIENRAIKRKNPNKIIAHGDILLVSDHNKAFVYDVELHLTDAEMKLLHYFLNNRGYTLSHNQIHTKIKNTGYIDLTPDMIYGLVKRLRKKLRDATKINYIKNERNVGYRFITPTNDFKEQTKK